MKTLVLQLLFPLVKRRLGRVFNVLGETIDGGPEFGPDAERNPIHRDAPKYDELTTSTEVLETGIKVIDLLAPYVRGGKDWVCSVVPVLVKLF